MRRAFFNSILAAWLAAAPSASNAAFGNKKADPKDPPLKSAVLVEARIKGFSLVCMGFIKSKNEIVTASHCLRNWVLREKLVMPYWEEWWCFAHKPASECVFESSEKVEAHIPPIPPRDIRVYYLGTKKWDAISGYVVPKKWDDIDIAILRTAKPHPKGTAIPRFESLSLKALPVPAKDIKLFFYGLDTAYRKETRSPLADTPLLRVDIKPESFAAEGSQSIEIVPSAESPKGGTCRGDSGTGMFKKGMENRLIGMSWGGNHDRAEGDCSTGVYFIPIEAILKWQRAGKNQMRVFQPR
jgi:hypothetical protein